MTLEHNPVSPDVLLAQAAWARSLARSLVRDANDADDLEQQTWLTALERPPADGSAPRAWLGTVMRNWLRRRHRGDERRTRRERTRAERETRVQPSAEDVAARAETHRNVVREVLALDEPYRSTVLRRYFDEVSARDIAAEQSVPLDTVKTRLKRAMKQLRARLGAEERGDARRALLLLAGLAIQPRGEAVAPAAFALTVVQKTLVGVVLVALVLLLAAALPEDDGAPPPADVPQSVASTPAPTVPEPDVRPVPAVAPEVEPEPPPPPPTTATVRIRVRDETSGEALAAFRCSIALGDEGAVSAAADAGVLERELDVGAGGTKLVVRVSEPRPAEGFGRREILLAAGDTLDVDVPFRAREGTSGTVVGPDGRPVAGALVFYGNQIRARGDEPFKPFQAHRIRDGVETDAAGRFHLEGPAIVRQNVVGRSPLEARAEITVLHPGFSALTVSANAAARVELQPFGAVRGRLLDRVGQPVTEGEIALDRATRAQLGSDGGFAFEAAHAGVRGLLLPGRRYVGVVVDPGVTREVELGGWIAEVTLGLGPLAGRIEGRGTAVLIGRDDVFSVHPARIAGAVSTRLTDVLPGRFLLLVEGGRIGFVEIRGTAASVRPAVGDLTVTAPAGARVYLVPKGANELEKLMGGRIASRTVPDSGTVQFDLLPAGEYEVGVDRLGTFAEARVDGPGAAVELELR